MSPVSARSARTSHSDPPPLDPQDAADAEVEVILRELEAEKEAHFRQPHVAMALDPKERQSNEVYWGAQQLRLQWLESRDNVRRVRPHLGGQCV